MKRKGLFLVVAVLVLAMSLTACGKKERETDVQTLVVGMEAGYPPFNWTQLDDSNGAIQIGSSQEYAGGYDVEIVKKVAEALGRELVIEKLEWAGLLPALTSGTIDIIAAGMSPTSERAESIDFTDNYYKSDLVMIVKKGSPYEGAKSIQDFAGAKITGQQNTFHYSVIDQIEGVVKDTAMQDFPSMRTALQSGIIDGYVSERPEGQSVIDAGLDFVMVELEEGFEASDDDVAIAIGVKKDNPLTGMINEILKDITEDERQAIMDGAVKNQPAAN